MAATLHNQVTIPSNAISFTKITGWGTPVIVNGVLSPGTGSRIAVLYAEQDFTIENEAVAALAADRVITPDGSSYFVFTGQAALLVYDTEASRWRIVSTP